MIQVHPDLFVGSDSDYYYVASIAIRDEWRILHACKEPYHRDFVRYVGRGAPKDHPEYLVAVRGDQMALNMVDANDPVFFQTEMLLRAIHFIDDGLKNGQKVLVHCNRGESRSPSIALLYLAKRLNLWGDCSFDEAETEFLKLYPNYAPNMGIRTHLYKYWQFYGMKK